MPWLSAFKGGIFMNIKKYSPQILTVLGVAGLISTVVMAVKTTPKCEEIIDKAESRLREETKDENAVLDKKETAKCFVKAYWPTIAMGAVSTACFVASNYVSGKREAVMATAFGVSEAALRRFQDSTLETVGKNTMDEIRAKVADKQLKDSPLNETTEVTVTPKGETLCFDCYSGRYFKSDLESIRRVVNDLNEQLLTGDFVTLNDFYYNIGLSETKMGDNLGWHSMHDGQIDVKYSARIAENGEPCIVIDYTVEPAYWDNNYI